MSIERAADEPEEPVAAETLDSFFTTPYTVYDALHAMMHDFGLDAYQYGLAQATEAEAATVSIALPQVTVKTALLREALERFNATHSEDEIKQAAEGAQPYFGGAMGDLLEKLREQGAIVEIVRKPEDDPKTKLH